MRTEREIIKRVHEQVRKLRRSGELPPAPAREQTLHRAGRGHSFAQPKPGNTELPM